MNNRMKSWRHLAALALIVVALLIAPAMTLAQNPNPGVLPPNAHPHGKSYGQWSAAWWQWFLSIPTDRHPGLDPTGQFCAEGQSGKVVFLAANGATDPVPCTVRPGTAVFLAMANAECSTVEPPPFFGYTEQELRMCAKCFADHIDPSSLQVTLDGQALENLERYRVVSPLFTFSYPADNIFGIPNGPATGEAVSDGYWIYLAPLSAGEHTLSFSGSFAFNPGDDCGMNLSEPIAFGFAGSYRLMVQGGH
jgi:hypothetical protein